MNAPRRAVVDIGTNSVKLLVADWREGQVIPVLERSQQTRLGQGFYPSHRLRPEPADRTARAVREFTGLARQLGACAVRVVATSAARDAANPELLLAAVRQACGLPVEIISGEQEAEWAFRGVLSDPRSAGAARLILDVGGGSTEFILGEGTAPRFRQSFPLGILRLLEPSAPAEAPGLPGLARCAESIREFLATRVAPALQPALAACAARPIQLVGTGGTASILGAMQLRLAEFDRERLEALVLARDEVHRLAEHLWSLSLAERRRVPGLPPERADVILPGTAIYSSVMEEFGFSELRVSTRGMRFAALADPEFCWAP